MCKSSSVIPHPSSNHAHHDLFPPADYTRMGGRPFAAPFQLHRMPPATPLAPRAQVVAAGADRSLHVWEATSGRQRHTLTGHSGPVTAVALSPMDGRLAVSVRWGQRDWRP